MSFFFYPNFVSFAKILEVVLRKSPKICTYTIVPIIRTIAY